MRQRWQRLRLWLWLIPALLVLYSLQQFPVGQRLNLAMAPMLSALHTPARWWQELSLWFHERGDLHANYLDARTRLQQLAALVQEANSLREENRQLHSLLGIKAMPGFHWRAAKLLGRSPDKMSSRLMIRIQDAKSDDVVVSSEGLVGLIDRSSRKHAIVRTVLDASLAVPVTIRDRPLAAIVRGQGNSLRVEFVPIKHAPSVGSILVTSGAGGMFPSGIPVARITRILPVEGEIFAEVEAEPLAHWRRDAWLAVALRKLP